MLENLWFLFKNDVYQIALLIFLKEKKGEGGENIKEAKYPPTLRKLRQVGIIWGGLKTSDA